MKAATSLLATVPQHQGHWFGNGHFLCKHVTVLRSWGAPWPKEKHCSLADDIEVPTLKLGDTGLATLADHPL